MYQKGEKMSNRQRDLVNIGILVLVIYGGLAFARSVEFGWEIVAAWVVGCAVLWSRWRGE